MYKIFITEVIVYVLGFVLCLSSLFSEDWFSLSSTKFKPNITGISFDLFRECISFVNGTTLCSIYSCSNNSIETKDFCLDIKRRVKCEQVVHIGDLCDNHAISYHEHDPNGRSPIDEMREADKHLKEWLKAFPFLFTNFY